MPHIEDKSAEAAARVWVEGLGAVLTGVDPIGALRTLFLPGGWWRDLLALTWDIRSFVGIDAMLTELPSAIGSTKPVDIRLSDQSSVALIPGEVPQITAYFSFDTAFGQARGFVRLLGGSGDDAGSWRALSVATQLEQLRGFDEPVGARRPLGTTHGTVTGRLSWAERRRREREFEDEHPRVVVIGAGQSGLAVGARLGALGIPTLLLDRNARVGDNWRNRYPSLTLHDPVGTNHLPYMPFPETWPKFTPKDKFAGWLEYYAEAMELNVWTSTEVLSVERDDAAGDWIVRVNRDGHECELRPAHVVVATGANGNPRLPHIPGQEAFRGTVVHSSRFEGGPRWTGRRAVVVGAGVSGHDVAQALVEHGAEVTLVQRSSTYVVSSDPWTETMLGTYLDGGPSTEDADLMSASVPFGLVSGLGKEPTAAMAEHDRGLLDGLRSAGFAVDLGPDGQGLFGKFLAGSDGYYIDVGASSMIVDGRIAIAQGAGIDHFEDDALVLEDGRRLPADLVVLATGYDGVLDSVRPILGAAADRCVPIYRLAPDGEMAGTWRHSGQDGLWFTVGNLHFARLYSRPLALRIAAIEAGLIDISHGNDRLMAERELPASSPTVTSGDRDSPIP